MRSQYPSVIKSRIDIRLRHSPAPHSDRPFRLAKILCLYTTHPSDQIFDRPMSFFRGIRGAPDPAASRANTRIPETAASQKPLIMQSS